MSHNNYTLRYRTFDQLFEDASVDMKNYALEGKLDPQTLIKVARRCNYMCGFRIYRTRQIVLEIENGRARLPDDFHILNFALVCGEWEWKDPLIQGVVTEERLINPFVPEWVPCPPDVIDPCAAPPDPCNPDPCENVCVTPCGDEFQVVQKIKSQNRVYKEVFPLYLTQGDRISCECINTQWQGSVNQGRIEDNWLYVNFDVGKVYLNYQGDMIDDNGNVLVPDHELLNDYYEYALKKRILENLLGNGEVVDPSYHQLIMGEFRAARNNALSVVNTPNFNEMKKLWQVNRKAQYHKYYNMFKSAYPYSTKPY